MILFKYVKYTHLEVTYSEIPKLLPADYLVTTTYQQLKIKITYTHWSFENYFPFVVSP